MVRAAERDLAHGVRNGYSRDAFSSAESQMAVIRFGVQIQPGRTQLGLAA